MFGHLIRNDKFIRFLIEGEIEGMIRRSRPRMAFSVQKVMMKVTGYGDVNELALDREEQRILLQQEQGS